ncbi:amino acid permease/ SLC12A domain-containing protein [Scheffersomyces amazonensis]|uniref:amino acid permease/ SLC12A domain-containing protein n=1 Tax=Scheffersomyces amazonensis TaxID=1078765 RepID=UPI00315CDF0C
MSIYNGYPITDESDVHKDIILEKEKDIESFKAPEHDYEIEQESELDSNLDLHLKRGLKDRHISLIALGGIIGPGILVGASLALSGGGPASLIIGFGVTGIISFIMMQSLGELATRYPTGGTFSTLGNRFVDKGYGLTVGWCYVIIWIAVLANEYNTVAAILQFWSGDKVPLYGYILIFWFLFLAFANFGVSVWGEAEYWLTILKIAGLVAFYIFSIVYVSGGIPGSAKFGFHYFTNPGAFSNGFKGVANIFVYSSTFFSGVETVALASTESRSPISAVPKAIRQTFYRIIIIYMGISISYGLTVPYNDPSLSAGTKTLKSPISIALRRAGWDNGVHLVNTFILLTCISAINSSIYIGSRTIVNLANEGGAPSFLKRVNKRGVPYFAVILMNLFGFLSLMNISTGAAGAYNYIVNISGFAVFIVWGNICFYHIRFRQAMKIQGRSLSELKYKGWLYPWLPIAGIVLNVFLGLIQGWSYFKPFDWRNFIDSYVLIPFFFISYLFFKLIHKSKWVDLSQVDLDEGRRREDFDKE